jgi:hypothetical protein
VWICLLSACWSAASPAVAASNKVRITGLSDVNFGNVSNLSADAVQSQSMCLFSDTVTSGYNVTASGSGLGGAFELASGSQRMAYEVQWNGSANRTSGSQLFPNVPLIGQTSAATQQTCNNGPATNASLIILLRSAALSQAMAGSYSGTLTLLVGPE